MTFDRAGLNISGRLHPFPKAQEPVTVQFPGLPDESRPRFASRRARLLLVLAAALFHVSVTATILMIGRTNLGGDQFDQAGLGTFASDGFVYQDEVLELCGVLKNQGVVAWATWPTQLHVRLYSLPVAFLNGGTHFDILTIEPLNLIYYLAVASATHDAAVERPAVNYRFPDSYTQPHSVPETRLHHPLGVPDGRRTTGCEPVVVYFICASPEA